MFEHAAINSQLKNSFSLPPEQGQISSVTSGNEMLIVALISGNFIDVLPFPF
jgi:hypothetical protein